MLRIVCTSTAILLLSACAPSTLSGGPSSGHLSQDVIPPARGTIPAPVDNVVPLPRPKAGVRAETYSVVVNNMRVQDLLFALARDARLNVDIHPGISGSVTMNALDQTLPQILARIAKQVDMRFELDGPNLAVMPDTPYLKNYKVDYVNLARDVSGTVSTNTQISTSAIGGAAGAPSAGGGNTSRIQIENKSRNRFWESLEKNIKDILHETDKVFPEGSTETVTEQNATQSTTGTGALASAVNTVRDAARVLAAPGLAGSPNPATLQNSGATVVKRMTFREAASVITNAETGIITVRATSRQHEKVQEFIDRVVSSARRQVLIEATIVEVTLSDGYQQGISWELLPNNNSGFTLSGPSTNTNVRGPTNPYTLKWTSTSRGVSAALEILRSFGTVKVLSSPKLTVLNNQTATLKVSEDFVYFNVKSDTTTTANVGTTVGVTTTPQSVSVGFFMSLTAQISDADTVTLNVRPSISSIAYLAQDPNPIIPKDIPNYIPQIRTREIESLMRVQSGETAVLGGLMEDRMDNRNGRIPLVGDIPLLGELFNSRNNTSSKTELVVFIRPTVIHDASVAGDFKHLAPNLPGRDFFATDDVYKPLGPLNANGETQP
ncbi:MAG: type II and III secretion system protein [Propionivibrio sp.]